jgi:hypothetical protein
MSRKAGASAHYDDDDMEDWDDEDYEDDGYDAYDEPVTGTGAKVCVSAYGWATQPACHCPTNALLS